MNREILKDGFIAKAKLKYGDKFDYSLVEYVNNSTLVTIICPEHGEFKIRPSVHITSKFGCQECAKETVFGKKREIEFLLFLERAKNAHNNKFDYSKVDYVNNSTPVIIICPEHGEFLQEPYSHMVLKFGCQKCAKEKQKHRNKPIKHYIEKSNLTHNNKFDYSLIKDEKIKRETKVPIKCENGHIFYQNFHDHASGNGCPYCAKLCVDTESFIKLSREKHGDKYDYSKVEYKKQKDKVVIICPKHGEFKQNPSNHYFLGRGCPYCKTSKGEERVKKFLSKNKIDFIQQKTFVDCKDKNVLPFDFYITNYYIFSYIL